MSIPRRASRGLSPDSRACLGLALVLVLGLPSCGLDGDRARWSVMHALEVRDEGSVVATWTIWGGWDEVRLPEVPPAGSGGSTEPARSFFVAAYDLNGEPIPLSGAPDHEIGYRLAEGEPEGVLDLDRPAEDRYGEGKVNLFGDRPGTVRIEFTLFHGGVLRQASLPIEVTVAE